MYVSVGLYIIFTIFVTVIEIVIIVIVTVIIITISILMQLFGKGHKNQSSDGKDDFYQCQVDYSAWLSPAVSDFAWNARMIYDSKGQGRLYIFE